ncbi:hypothetical protein [Nonomuraea sp. NEAU-A123]|uniref:hypothetical protein n=1 Tax=Nonomuraea sp. NEAU-A123 TaxID=2839649 RepID=UPI001BE450DA|nr:hypothetical protein [Nonomuraea sp. NEAU-A123]MBT2226601.1 hypothetical protein [Nonomuraea sp. NEAU-A123]
MEQPGRGQSGGLPAGPAAAGQWADLENDAKTTTLTARPKVYDLKMEQTVRPCCWPTSRLSTI